MTGSTACLCCTDRRALTHDGVCRGRGPRAGVDPDEALVLRAGQCSGAGAPGHSVARGHLRDVHAVAALAIKGPACMRWQPQEVGGG